jgi:hypothetical protein
MLLEVKHRRWGSISRSVAWNLIEAMLLGDLRIDSMLVTGLSNEKKKYLKTRVSGRRMR